MLLPSNGLVAPSADLERQRLKKEEGDLAIYEDKVLPIIRGGDIAAASQLTP